MSKCMTIADEAIDKKKISTDVTAKGVVEFILEEAVVAALCFADKGCSHIGDFSITEDFCQQFDQVPAFSKDLDFITGNQNLTASGPNQDLKLDSGESIDRSISILTARENLELILDTLGKPADDRAKGLNDCKIIKEDFLGKNELRIENGQIHLGKTNVEEVVKQKLDESFTLHYLDHEDIAPSEKNESEYFNLQPFNPRATTTQALYSDQGKGNSDLEAKDEPKTVNEEARENQFMTCKTEELRQVLSEVSIDPNRPRACSVIDEDVKKMIKEIEEINFKQNNWIADEVSTMYRSDGKGDADLESQSLNLDVSPNDDKNKNHSPNVIVNVIKSNVTRSSKEAFEPWPGVKKDEWLPYNDQCSENENFAGFQLANEANESKSCYQKFYEENDRNVSAVAMGEEVEDEIKGDVGSALTKQQSACDLQCAPSNLHLKNDNSVENLNETVNEKRSSTGSPPQLCDAVLYEDSNVFDLGASKEISHDGEVCDPEAVVSSVKVNSSDKAFEFDGCASKNAEDVEAENAIFSASHKGGVKLRRSQSGGREVETAVREARLSSEKGLYNLKGSQSVNNADEGPQNDQGTSNLARIKTENVNDGSCSLEKEVEVSSNGSDSFVENRMRSLMESGTGLVLPKVSLFSRRSEDDMVEVERNNHINYDSSFMMSELKCMPDDTSRRSQESIDAEREIHSSSYSQESKEENNKNVMARVEDTRSETALLHGDENSVREKPGAQPEERAEILLNDSQNGSEENFKCGNYLLHSKKMYPGLNFPGSSGGKETMLTYPEESFIDFVENVIQIIEPEDSGNEEDSPCISFSLQEPREKQSNNMILEPENSVNVVDDNLNLQDRRKTYSGMTTIGPLKNVNYDPKDLAPPDIDYGRMTHITSSGQLEQDLSAMNVKLTEIVNDESDDDTTEAVEEEHLELRSVVNRDIASLTKVQKVRGVLSYHPKPEEDFEDESNLNRPRLDLKDVESMTDERYKVPDVSIPLLSFEVGDNNLEVDKEFVENILSGNCFDENDLSTDSCITDKINKEIDQTSFVVSVRDYNQEQELNLSYSLQKLKESKPKINVDEKTLTLAGSNQEDAQGSNTDFQCQSASKNQKYGTLGSVFRKASTKFNRKDNDLFLRTSKSLPRDTSKLAGSDSIKSILDDCQSSATNILKKSRSFLKNTQSILKTLSQSRFGSVSGPGFGTDSANGFDEGISSPSQSDMRNSTDRNLLTFLRKEDFVKAKNIIKNKMEKTFKTTSDTSTGTQSVGSMEEKDGGHIAENCRVDRVDNLRKLLPKSPLIYKSQFVKSQISFQHESFEKTDLSIMNSTSNPQEIEKKNEIQEMATITSATGDEQVILKVEPQKSVETLRSEVTNESENQVNEPEHLNDKEEHQPEFIVMQTVQGLPSPNLESLRNPPDAESAASFDQALFHNIKDDSEMNVRRSKMEMFSSLPDMANETTFYDNSPQLSEANDAKSLMLTSMGSAKKIRDNKGKKFTARLRSLWCSAFGKVKTPTDKNVHS